MTAEAVNEEETLDGELELIEETDDSSSENEDVSEQSEKKNSSNWKKMSEAKKQLARELQAEREAKEALANDLRKLQEWANSLYEDEAQKPFVKKEEPKVNDDKSEKLEAKLFLIENKDATQYMDEVMAARQRFGMEYEEAWTYVKAKLPAESKSKTLFSAKNKTTAIPKDLTKVSAEDALSLPPAERAKWRQLNGWEK